jgi:hypothetical protein
MKRAVLSYALSKIAEHGWDLVQSGGITGAQLKDALDHRERELSTKTDSEIALQLLNDLPHGCFAQC